MGKIKLKFNYKQVMMYLLFSICFFILMRANIASILPFAFAFFCSLLYLKKNAYILAGIYCLMGYVSSFDLHRLLYFSSEAVAMLVIWIIHKYSKNDMKAGLLPVYMIISRVVFHVVYFVDITPEVIALRIVETVLTVVFCYAFNNGLRAMFVRGLRFKSTLDELVSLSIILLALYVGIFGIAIFKIKLAIVVGVFLILMAAAIFGSQGGMIIGGILGLGGLVYSMSGVYLAAFCLYGLCAAVFTRTSKVLSALSVVLCELVLSYFFNLYDVYSYHNIIAIALPAIAFIFIPQKGITYLRELMGGVGEKTLSRYIVNRNKFETSKKLLQMGEVFREMQTVYENLACSSKVVKDNVNVIKNELKMRTCEGCFEADKCWVKHKQTTEDGISNLLENGLTKGKVTLLDLSDYLAARCVRVSSLLQNSNNLLNTHMQNISLAKNLDSGKLILARQMKGVSEVFENLSKSVSERVVFNLRLEKNLIDEFCYNNIVCNEVVVSGEDNLNLVVHAVVLQLDINKKNIGAIISKVCKTKMMLVSSEFAEKEGWVVIMSKPMPKYDVTFGVSMATKTGSNMSGDTHSLIRISEDKFMLCVCDGMGSGDDAEKISNTSISLVESFYQAGFSNDIILHSVNKLLAYVEDDAFVAIDIGVMDLKNGSCDFIKIGGSESFIKTKNGVITIEGSSLPLGILDDITPWSKSEALEDGDFVILCSDGVRECFGSRQELENAINRISSHNPEIIADYLLDEAVVACGGNLLDDMTVIVCKLYKK